MIVLADAEALRRIGEEEVAALTEAATGATFYTEGTAWLGADRALWLNVIRHNERAIRFYRRFGFEIDPGARTSHVVPHAIMRRSAAA